MSTGRELDRLREHIEELDDLLTDSLDYLQHKPDCARLLTRGDCSCNLVTLMTRVHAELDEDEDEEPDEEEDEGDES